MPAPLHPELHKLHERYNSLIDDYEAGHISYDDAIGTLNSLRVVDGQGAHWGVSDEGDFVKAFPGQPETPADPIGFVPPQLPARPASATAPWDNPDLIAPPSRMGSSPFPFPQQAGSTDMPPGMPGGHPQAVGVPSNFGEPTPEQRPAKKAKAPKAEKEPKAPKPPKAPKGPSGPNPLAGILASVLDRLDQLKGLVSSGRGRTIALGLVCAIVLVGVYFQTQGGNDEETGIPSGTPSVTAPGEAPPLPADGALPGEAAPVDPAAPAAPAAPTAPNGDQVSGIIAGVTGGADAASLVVVTPGDDLAARLAAAELAGLADAGLQIVPAAAAAASPEGQGAVQTWNLVDAADPTVVLSTAPVQFVLEGETWKIATFPVFTAI